MSHRFYFQDKFTLEARTTQCERLRQTYPDRIPVIVESCKARRPKYRLQKSKYLVPREYPVAKFLLMLRSNMLKLHRDEAIFLFTEDNRAPAASETMGHLYDQRRHTDGFLYLHYAFENAFGADGGT